LIFASENAKIFSYQPEERNQSLFAEFFNGICYTHITVDEARRMAYVISCNTFGFNNLISTINLDTRENVHHDMRMGMDYMCTYNDSMLIVASYNRAIPSGKLKLSFFNKNTNEIADIDLSDYDVFGSCYVNYIHIENSSTIWATTFDCGLLKIHMEELKIQDVTFINPPDAPSDNNLSVNFDKSGNILLSTYDGLYVIDSTNYEVQLHIDDKAGLSNNIITAATEDDFNHYWIATYAGLNVYDLKTGMIGSFHAEDGIPDDEFNRNAFLEDDSGNIYFGTGNGAVKIQPDIFNIVDTAFRIILGYTAIIDESSKSEIYYGKDQIIRFHASEEMVVECHFSNNDWGLQEHARYDYFIDGFSKNWQQIDADFISLSRMPPGIYNLKIRAISKYGRISHNELSVKFEVIKYLYERVWFWGIIGFLIAIAISYWYLYNKNESLNQRLKIEKKVSELELSLLRTQMNPHFVFNALGAIQYFIHQSKQDIAEVYLSKFASLIRMYLESSRKRKITLKEEISLLKLYVEMEQMRYFEKFSSKFSVDDKLGLKKIMVPSMLLQPLVENAINHGLFHKKGKGHLEISFKKEGNSLQCIIDDNGIGRKRVKEILARSLNKHKSRSGEITAERLQIMREMEEINISIDYTDFDVLTDGRSGTQVLVSIPIPHEHIVETS
jgi:anti-sigma regulatory factor (Ser/Thr protein kinase)